MSCLVCLLSRFDLSGYTLLSFTEEYRLGDAFNRLEQAVSAVVVGSRDGPRMSAGSVICTETDDEEVGQLVAQLHREEEESLSPAERSPPRKRVKQEAAEATEAPAELEVQQKEEVEMPEETSDDSQASAVEVIDEEVPDAELVRMAKKPKTQTQLAELQRLDPRHLAWWRTLAPPGEARHSQRVLRALKQGVRTRSGRREKPPQELNQRPPAAKRNAGEEATAREELVERWWRAATAGEALAAWVPDPEQLLKHGLGRPYPL